MTAELAPGAAGAATPAAEAEVQVAEEGPAKDLQELIRRRPVLADALPGVVLELLRTPVLGDPHEPFQDDEAFHRFLVAKVSVAARGQEASTVLAKAAVEWHSNAEHGPKKQREVKAAMVAASEVFGRIQQSKVAAAAVAPAEGEGRRALLPRFVRLIQRLELSDKEVRAFEFLLVHQSAGDVLRSQSAINAPPLELVGYTGMTPKELLDFASHRRRHMAQGLLADVSLSMNHSEHRMIEDEFDLGRPSMNRAVLSAEAAKALVGAKLTPSEMLKLDQHGALASVLQEEVQVTSAPAAEDAPAEEVQTATVLTEEPPPGAGVSLLAAGAGEAEAARVLAAGGADASNRAPDPVLAPMATTEDALPGAGISLVSPPVEVAPAGGGRSTKRPAPGQGPSGHKQLRAPPPGGKGGGGNKRLRPGGFPGMPDPRLVKLLTGAGGLPPGVGLTANDGDRGAEDWDDGEDMDDEISEPDDDSGDGLQGDDVLSSLLLAERRRDARRSRNGAAPDLPGPLRGMDAEDGDGQIRAYKTDLEYLVDAVELVAQKGRLYRVKQKLDDRKGGGGEEGQPEDEASPWVAPWERRRGDAQRDRRRERELEGLVKQLGRKMEERMKLTREAADAKDSSKGIGWVPRLERILSSRQMGTFEKEVLILLVGGVLLPSKVQHIMNPSCPGYLRKGPFGGGATVGELLSALSPDLQSQISNRKSFYKDGSLVRDGMVHVGSNGMRGDLTSCPVEIDRRMVDFIVGLDSEVHQLVDGSHMYVPKTRIEQVVLAADTKALISTTVQNFAAFRRNKKQYGLAETISALGLVMLFYGDSGTGKTMTANAVAHLLGKKLLLVNFPSLGGENAADIVRMIFRESKINDAVLFFDECESIFESREKSRLRDVNMLLTELERHDGLIILATNRPYDLDEAMHRRITLAIEFHKPDHILRRDIWKALLPPALPLAPDVDIAALAMRYELTGGFIKNAILSALSIATTRAAEKGHPNQVTITQEDLTSGAQLQLRGRLAMRSFERRVVPKRGLDGLVCAEDLIKKVQAVVDFEKSKTVLYGQWGFGGSAAFSGGQPQIGSCVLFHGAPGTGKSLAAQAIGFEVGRPLKVVNAANVLDKYVGETGKNIEKVFSEARAMDAVLVFDEAEGLFGRRMAEASSSVDKHTNLDTGLLLHWLDTYPGLCILTTNAKEAIDSAFFRRFRFIIEFPKPDRATRCRLWRSCIPAQAPLAPDADLMGLASEFDSFSGGDIQNAVIRAASRAALRSPEDLRIIRQSDLRTAALEEGSKQADEALKRLYA